MSFQKNEESDLDFSVIDKKSTREDKLNFSVESLLEEHSVKKQETEISQEEDSNIDRGENVETNRDDVGKGSFLNCLDKLENELSFETQLYDVYRDDLSVVHSLNPLTKSNVLAKSNSNLKTTKQQSNSQSIDDYGYLVIDFAPMTKRKKSSRVEDLSKITHKNDKMHTHQGTLSTHKLKLSSASSNGVLGDFSHSKVAEKCTRSKSKAKSIESVGLGKLLSPPRIARDNKSSSKQKTVIKGVKTRPKQQGKQVTVRIQKSPNVIKTLSKSKSPSRTLLTTKSSKATNHSTTIAQSGKISNKSYTKSTNREGNAYSDYYGFEDVGESERLVMRSNCVYTKSQKFVKSPGTKKLTTTGMKSKSKCKKVVHSPSPTNKDLTLRFKKKKVVDVS